MYVAAQQISDYKHKRALLLYNGATQEIFDTPRDSGDDLASFPGSLFLLCADGEKDSPAYTVCACAKYCLPIAVNRTIAQIIATDIEYGWKNLQFLSNRG